MDPHCKTCTCAEPPKGPSVRRAPSTEVGGCCGCTRHINVRERRTDPHFVTVIEGNHLQVRYCDDCMAVIREKSIPIRDTKGAKKK